FNAPAGTSITRLRLWREIGKQLDEWELYTRTADGAKLSQSDCNVPPDEFRCTVGAPGGAASDWSGLNTASVRVGIACTNVTTTCATGATIHEAWTAIYSAIVTVDDPTAPAVSGPGGALFGGGYVRGTVSATLGSASDNTGIRAVQVRRGAAVVGETAQSCDDSRRVPCADPAGPTSVSVNTAALADGSHTLEVGATDAAGNYAGTTPQQVTVDNTAPAAPTVLGSATMTVRTGNASVFWEEPAAQVAPIVAARMTVCGPRGCAQHRFASRLGERVPLNDGVGTYSVSVALEDAAGNVSLDRAARWTVFFGEPPLGLDPLPGLRAAPVPVTTPAPATAPTVRPLLPTPRVALARPVVARDRRTITARGSVAAGVAGRVIVSATAKIGRRTRTVTTRVAIRNRRYTARLRLPSGAWRIATVAARFAATATHRAERVTRTVRQRTR
ncbi:MAG: hypothetical protein QOF04_600, partial [Solirubrobacteraceae bacterium]|nr:hypothetical protein [Solirubrobacteraceae bacterium]